MANENDWGQILHEWQFPEYHKHARGRTWYIVAAIIIFVLVAYGLMTQNFLFALMVVLFSVIILLNHSRAPQMLDFRVTDKGLAVNERLYPYEELQSFWIINEPPVVKKLYFSFEKSIRPALAVSLADQNPEEVKITLSNYLPEDTDQKDEPLSDLIWRALKL